MTLQDRKYQSVRMKNKNSGKQNNFFKHWYFRLVAGIASILTAVWFLIAPEKGVASPAAVFSLTLIFTGILEIISSIQLKNLLTGWGLFSAAGVFGLLIGILFIMTPQISNAAFILIAGFALSLGSVKIIAWSRELKRYGVFYGGLFLLGATFGVMLSFLFLSDRSLAWLTFLFFTSFTLQAAGVSEIYFSFLLKKIKNNAVA
jgi:uncharacterized membrane protein HdeD (DUF308 family)